METLYCEIIPNWKVDESKVEVELRLTNALDALSDSRREKTIRCANVRAIVDVEATLLVLPQTIIAQLGLLFVRNVNVRFSERRPAKGDVYGPVMLEVQGRIALVEALRGPDDIPPLLGNVPLTLLDFRVDKEQCKLLPNPESPDVASIDVL